MAALTSQSPKLVHGQPCPAAGCPLTVSGETPGQVAANTDMHMRINHPGTGGGTR
ncbi:hypothetical protein MXD62_19315 [Frankia sp. Mgl5]|uniref:hypothetical protein n=1 Tax=Frankia sp. Mgl5 TaxID=2933793 RepID=UPI00200DA5CB|nr:hypothetical protein [Frankia sp. Mgl5]MCK9929301.1 hypothetical protein [Frankia sp. Mgl5]